MAEIFSEIFKSPVTLDKNLREMNFGECAGKTQEWQREKFVPPPLEDNRLDHRVFKDAESRRETGTRAYTFWHELLKKQDENIIVITHGFMLTFLILAWMKIPVENMDYGNFLGGGRVV